MAPIARSDVHTMIPSYADLTFTTRNLVMIVVVKGCSPIVMGRSIVPTIRVQCPIKPSRGYIGSSSFFLISIYANADKKRISHEF